MTVRVTPTTDANPYYEWTLKESTDYLRWLLREFPFADWKDIQLSDEEGGDGTVIRQSRSQAVQVAAMLSLFCVGMVPDGANRMGFIYNANSQRSGKTLLAKLAIMAIYKSFKGQPWKGNEEELNKLIDAEMLHGSNYICFDNVRGYLGSQTLEGLMTAPEWTGRVLGKTQMFTVKNRMTLFVTGNACSVSPDMAHRCLICDLFVEEGDVQERVVENLLDEPWLMELENRRRIASALWGIVRSWSAAGMPPAISFGFKPRLGFERWGQMIGGLVAHAGFGNCMERVQLESAGDSEERNIRKLIDALVDLSLTDRGEFSFQRVVNVCHDEGLFDWMLDGRDQEGDYKLSAKARSTFGLTLGRYAPNVDATGHPRMYRKEVDRLVLFGCKGSGRHRVYFVEQKSAVGVTVAPPTAQ